MEQGCSGKLTRALECQRHRVPVAQWIRREPTELEIPGSSPGRYVFSFCFCFEPRTRPLRPVMRAHPLPLFPLNGAHS